MKKKRLESKGDTEAGRHFQHWVGVVKEDVKKKKHPMNNLLRSLEYILFI